MDIEEILNKVWNPYELVLMTSRPLTQTELNKIQLLTKHRDIRIQRLLISFEDYADPGELPCALYANVRLVQESLADYGNPVNPVELVGCIQTLMCLVWYPKNQRAKARYVPDDVELTCLIKMSEEVLRHEHRRNS